MIKRMRSLRLWPGGGHYFCTIISMKLKATTPLYSFCFATKTSTDYPLLFIKFSQGNLSSFSTQCSLLGNSFFQPQINKFQLGIISPYNLFSNIDFFFKNKFLYTTMVKKKRKRMMKKKTIYTSNGKMIKILNE